MSETLEQIVRDLHKQLPMATQEDAIEFARRLVTALGAQKPVAWMDAIDGQLWREKSEYHNRDIPLYTAPVVPADWQMVPKEPTPEMLNSCWRDYPKVAIETYKAMLAAAPEYKP